MVWLLAVIRDVWLAICSTWDQLYSCFQANPRLYLATVEKSPIFSPIFLYSCEGLTWDWLYGQQAFFVVNKLSSNQLNLPALYPHLFMWLGGQAMLVVWLVYGITLLILCTCQQDGVVRHEGGFDNGRIWCRWVLYSLSEPWWCSGNCNVQGNNLFIH